MGMFRKLIGAAGLAAGAAYLSKAENRNNLKKQLDKTLSRFNKSPNVEPVDIADAKMMDEGALTSIQYYNELQEEDSK